MLFRAQIWAMAVLVGCLFGIGRGLGITPLAAEEPKPAEKKTPPFKGHALPRLRGVMSSPSMKEEDFRVLGEEWKANLIRWQIVMPSDPEQKLSYLPAYDKWFADQIKALDEILPFCEKFGLLVVVDLQTPPGGKSHMFTSKAYNDKFLEVWELMARRYKDRKIIWGYDLCNEPNDSGRGKDTLDWRGLALAAARKIREIDPDRAIVVEPLGGTFENLKYFEPLPVSRVVYSAHMYSPMGFTHQGVYKDYPAPMNGPSKEHIRADLQSALDYQRKYNVHFYVGEFSSIRWAPGESAHDYLRDVIDIAEEYNWDWSYHAFREWDGWSVEHDGDPKNHEKCKTQTSREQLLRSWFEKNTKPAK